MKIVLDTQSTLGRKTGIGQYATHLLDALRRTAPDYEFVSLDWGRAQELRTDRRLVWQQLSLPNRARKAKADLLHIPGFDAPLIKPCPVVITVHDLIGLLFPEDLPPVSRFYWSRWLPWSVRWADQVIVDSEHTRQDVIRLLALPDDRLTVIPLGVDPEFHPLTDQRALQAVRSKFGLPHRFILYLGTLQPRKGLDTLVAAYAALASQTDRDLVIAGKKGWHTDALFRQVNALGLAERVHFTDYVPDEDVAALLNLSEVFAFPSRYEGFGLPPLEAMACGAPVIAANSSSLPEVVGDAGLLVPPDDIRAWVDALRRMLADDALRLGLRAKGLERARQFTWERTARETMRVYEKTLR